MKAAARRAYGAQLPNGDQRMVRCQGRLTAWLRPSKPPVSQGEYIGAQQGFICPARGLNCRLCWSQRDLATSSTRIRAGLQPGAALEEGRLPQSHAPSRASCRCLTEGAWVLTAPLPCYLGRRGAACLPWLRGLRGCSSSTMVETRRRWALCHIPIPVPIPGRCRSPPRLRGNGSQGSSMPNFTFQIGLLAPGQAALRVVKYFGKPRLGFSLKSLFLGKRRQAEQQMQSQHRGERRTAGRILSRRCWCWGAGTSHLGCTGDRSWAG